jgi:hypothetical protein
MIVFENNTATNIGVGMDAVGNVRSREEWKIVDMSGEIGNTIIYKNHFDRGAWPGGSTVGIDYPGDALIEQRENLWQGFETRYKGDLPGIVLEAPYRVIGINVPQGGSAEKTLLVWNAGTAPLQWSAAKDAAWLGLSPGSGTIDNENSTAEITLSCNAADLGPGLNTTTVTITAGSAVMKTTINAQVDNPAAIEGGNRNRLRLTISPNPACKTASIRISFSLNEGEAQLRIYDAQGELIKDFGSLRKNGNNQANAITWDGRDNKKRFVPTGGYMVQLRQGNQFLNKQIMLLR